MIRALLLPAVLGLLLSGCFKSDRLTVYVAPEGNDAAAGSESSPLCSLAGARDRVRRLRGEMKNNLPIEVVFEDGVYRFETATQFGPEDAGVAGSPVTYRARNRGKAVFDGGLEPKWEKLSADDPARRILQRTALPHVRTTKVPDGVELPGFTGGRCYPNAHPAWLYSAGAPLPIASYPDAARKWEDLHLEFARIQYSPEIAAKNKKNDKLTDVLFPAPRIRSWAEEPDLWMYGLLYVHWDDSYSKIVAVDPEKNVLTIDRKSIVYLPGINGSCRIMNAISELDRPGEWAIDRKRRRLYFWPEGDSGPSLSAASTLLEVSGARDLTFDGFLFTHSRAEAVVFKDCTNVTLRGSCVRAIGGFGVNVSGGRECLVVDCDLTHLGEGGILLSGGNYASLEPAGHLASNNHVSYWGDRLAFYRSAIGFGGVNIQSPSTIVGCRIEHNLMHHGRHLAVRLHGNDVTVAWNVIHDVCAATYDAGAIYGYTESDWSQGRGALIEHNVFHSTGHLGAGKLIFPIYNDGFLSGVTSRGNIVVVGDIGLFSQGGHANIYERNIVVCCTKAAHRSNLGKRHPAARADSKMWKNLQKNRSRFLSEPWKSRFPELARQAAMTNAQFAQSALFTSFKDNIFACSGAPHLEDQKELEKWNVFENNVSLQDPGFVDFAAFDWRLKPDSRAAAVVGDLGFEKMGLKPSPARYSPPVKFGPGVSPVPPLKTPLSAAVVRIDMERTQGSFTKDNPMADELIGCEVPDWSAKRNRVRSAIFDADASKWQEYSLSFIPRSDGDFRIFIMGSRGRMTAVDDVRVEGAELINGGFEADKGWAVSELKTAFAANEPEYAFRGIVDGTSAVPAAEGRRLAVVNHDFVLSQTVRLKAGVRFKLTWKARAWK